MFNGKFKIIKLKKQREEVLNKIEEKWNDIEHEQKNLKEITVLDEVNALTRFFLRQESCKSKIESLFMDASLQKKEVDKHLDLKMNAELNYNKTYKKLTIKSQDIKFENDQQI